MDEDVDSYFLPGGILDSPSKDDLDHPPHSLPGKDDYDYHDDSDMEKRRAWFKEEGLIISLYDDDDDVLT